MKYLSVRSTGIGLLLGLLGFQAMAAEEVDCSEIENAVERLACYDGQFGRDEKQRAAAESSAEETVPAVIESSPVVEQRKVEPPAEAAPPAAEPPAPEVPAAAVGAVPEAGEHTKGGLFGDERVTLTTTIAAIREGEKQKMIFRLANDQIWIQANPRPLPFEVGDTVTIKNAWLGGYFMTAEKGTSTRVQRIK
jgi:hypothetical protein